jgi:hypothetical protein
MKLESLCLFVVCVAALGAGMQTGCLAAEPIRFSAEKPWVATDGEVLNPAVHRIDVSKQRAGTIPDLPASDWTVAVWNFPAWNPGGKHMPELAFGKTLRLPLLYDSSDPECLHNGVYYYRLSNPDAMDWQIKWMREAGINLVMFDWYPSESKEAFDNSPRHHSINASIEEGFLGKSKTGGSPVKTNRFEKKMKFLAMWTNHGHAWIPQGTMEYACENFLNQPNYYTLDGKPIIIIHAPGILRDEHGGEGTNHEKMENLRKWILEQRTIAASYGHPEVIMALGAIYPQFARDFKEIGFDMCFTYLTPADEELETVTPVEFYKNGEKVADGELHEADYETVMIPSQKKFWTAQAKVWGPRNYVPTVTMRADWRHWHPQRMLYYHGCTPDVYGKTLKWAKRHVEQIGGRKFLTVGIWNEIYEDEYIEPDVKYGYEYSKRIKAAFGENSRTEK